LLPRKPTVSWAASKETWPAGQTVLPLYYALMRPYLKYRVHLKEAQHRKTRPCQRTSRGGHKNRGLVHLCCEERLRELGLFSLENRRLQETLIKPSSI